MHEKKRKNGIFQFISNASSMMLVIAFLVLCVVIAVIIGVHSAEKGKEETSGETVQGQPSAYESSGSVETVGESGSSDAQDIIFEGCGADGVLVDMIHTSGWGEKDDPFVQYDIVIENTRDADISDWCVRIKVGADASCFNIWNGIAQIEDGVLIITPAEFNGALASGTQTSIGIIIEKPQTPVFEDVTFK